jgi:hypothetical protein
MGDDALNARSWVFAGVSGINEYKHHIMPIKSRMDIDFMF